MSKGTGFFVVAAILTLIGTAIHVFPPHLTVVTVIFSVAAVFFHALGIARLVGLRKRDHRVAQRVLLYVGILVSFGVMGMGPIAATTVARAVLGESQTCTVTQYDTEIEHSSRGRTFTTYVHQVQCPDGSTHEIRSSVMRGSPAEVVTDASGWLTPGFAARTFDWLEVGFFALMLVFESVVLLVARRFAPSAPAPQAFYRPQGDHPAQGYYPPPPGSQPLPQGYYPPPPPPPAWPHQRHDVNGRPGPRGRSVGQA
ncbi:hypothetical protein [Nonomuraea sp. GTA35]|uniref:hypothetical protein n=1 Tax=Nonomuraea sp. GTA35 TaxID=1676746 RepID=UPI0035C0750D